MLFFRSKHKKNPKLSNAQIEKLLSAARFSSNQAPQQFKQQLLADLLQESRKSSTPAVLNTTKHHARLFFAIPALALCLLLALTIANVQFGWVMFPWQKTDAPPVAIQVAQPLSQEEIEQAFILIALDKNDAGIHPTTRFQLTTTIQTTVEKLQETLSFTPAVAYAIEPSGENTYIITPENPLEAAHIVSARVLATFVDQGGNTKQHTYTWSYQVQEIFQVVETLPRHASTHVPIDTGIEIRFSHTDFQGAEEQFSIEPQIAGRFEIHRKTLVFVPEQKLQEGTLYTVRLGKSVRLESTGETIQQDVQFQFETKKESSTFEHTPGITNIIQHTNESSSEQAPIFIVSGFDLHSVEKTTLTIYQFADITTYENAVQSYNQIPNWTQYTYDEWHIDINKLTKRIQTEVPLEDVGNYWQYAITAPEPLPIGYYLVEVGGQNNTTLQSFLQVSDMSAYVTTSATDMLVWAHDTKTKKPCTGASITLLDGTVLGETDQNGMMRIVTPETLKNENRNKNNAIRIAGNNQMLVLPLSGNAQEDGSDATFGQLHSPTSQSYWSYLYLDQPYYQPQDTLNFWGVIDARSGEKPKQVSIQITDGYSGSNDRVVLLEKAVSVGDFGTIEGAMPLENLLPQGYSASVIIDGNVVVEKFFSVMSYSKPAYTLSITPESSALISGETMTHTLHARTFDGTPVAALPLSIHESTLTTDDIGLASFTHTYGAEKNDSRNRSTEYTEYLFAGPTQAEEGEITAEAHVRVFPASEIMDVTAEYTNKQGRVKGTLYTLDLEALNKGTVDFYTEPYGEPIAENNVQIVVTRLWSEKKQTGTTYNYIEKKQQPVYEYTEKAEEVMRRTVTTDVQGAFSLEFPTQEDTRYRITVESIDSNGRTVQENRYIYAQETGMMADSDFFNLRFVQENQTEQYSQGNIQEFSIGEHVQVEFYRGNSLLPAAPATFLFMQAQNGIQETALVDESRYQFTFDEQDIPNVIVQGIWFDGRSYWVTSSFIGLFGTGMSASFKEEDRRLNIDMQFDKETYAPGETVALDIAVARPDGSGTEAAVNVNIIDEALYAVLEKDVRSISQDYVSNFRDILYRDLRAEIYTSYASHRYPAKILSGDGGGGGKGDRKIFQDKALFKTVKTNAQGKAHIEFTLPDNITSWRVTTHALDAARYAESTTHKLTVTQDFFVDAVLSSTYIVDDKPIGKARVLGTGVQSDDSVEITVSSTSLGMEPQQFTTTGFAPIEFSLPQLVEGKQEITISAKSTDMEDTIIRTIDILPSNLVIPFAQTEDVQSGWKPSIETDQQFEIIFSDKSSGVFYPLLHQYFYSWSDRLDQRVGKMFARDLLQQYFSEHVPTTSAFDPAAYQTSDGGLSLFPYSDNDVVLSAHIAASTMGEKFDQARLADYFESVLNDPSQTTFRHAMSLYGLAGLHEPVLLEVQEVLMSKKITDVDRLYLTLALAKLGNQEEARILFAALKKQYGKQLDSYQYIELGDTADHKIANTLAMATIAAYIQDPYASQWFAYVQDNTPNETVFTVQELNYIALQLALLPEIPAHLVYEYAGNTHDVQLEKGKIERAVVMPKDMQTFTVQSVEGTASAVIRYTRKATEEELTTNTELSITRTYEPTAILEGDLVKIMLNVTVPDSMPDGSYQITDFVPSGLRIITRPYAYAQTQKETALSYPYSIDGQRISFMTGEGHTTVTYFARVVNTGEFIAEPAVLQSLISPNIRVSTADERIVVHNKK